MLSYSTTSIATAEIANLLGGEITPTGKAARIATLLKGGGYTIAFRAPEPGRAVIDWYQLPAGAKLARKAKPILVAAGQSAFPGAGIRKIKLKLTSAGKGLLKRQASLKLTAKGTFVPAGGAPIVVTKAFVLRR